MTLDVTWALQWVRRSAEVVAEHRVELIELDRQIGDGDHGENLHRGFTAVVSRLDGLETAPTEVGEVLKVVATTLMSTVGGAAGPLYGTAYLRAAKVTGLAELGGDAVVALLEAGLEGVVARGKATTGEKTMVDAWSPAVAAAQEAAARGDSPVGVLDAEV
uniref:dihydroxyacetone kinase subunit DhaL n=1 Tax=Actinotalea sp. C106 TaxID=2908644 RepID=UPI0020279122